MRCVDCRPRTATAAADPPNRPSAHGCGTEVGNRGLYGTEQKSVKLWVSFGGTPLSCPFGFFEALTKPGLAPAELQKIL